MTMTASKFIFLLTFINAIYCNAFANESAHTFLKAFHANPYLMMQRLPSIIDKDGHVHSRGYIHKQRHLADVIRSRNETRRTLMNRAGGLNISSTPEANDRPERIVGTGQLTRNIFELEKMNLTQTELDIKPWSDSYWPIYKGMLATRYADQSYPDTKEWLPNFLYATMWNTADNIVNSGDLSRINALSPAEKYDYAMGDRDFTLTKYSWNQGKRYVEKGQSIPTWMGICHGWAGAAHMQTPISRDSLTVRAVDGTPIIFYPQDIKALQSMLWANASPSTRFAGNRCAVINPMRNLNGRVLDQNCFDTNPSTWHLAVINQLGLHRRSIVIDATYDAEVWNFPIFSYKYKYFNPQTLQETKLAAPAIVRRENYRIDKFPEFRSAAAKYIIGIVMEVSYVKEMKPMIGFPNNDPQATVRLIYDLELDENKNIVGGEWYGNAHPDFLWTYDENAQARTREDGSLSEVEWAFGTSVPSNWTAYAQSASARGTPLFTFLAALLAQPLH